MTFYRVEHPSTAKGPYCGDVSSASTRNRPVPFQDGIGEWWRDDVAAYDADLEYVFGFESLRQLYDWFRGDLQRLQDLGYLIHKYEPTDAGGHNYRHNFKVHRGKCQVIFARQRSEFDECECVDWWVVRGFGLDL